MPAHEFGHDLSLADHPGGNCAENTLMLNYTGITFPPAPCAGLSDPTAADAASVFHTVYQLGPVMALDSPIVNQAVTQPFNVGGWAIDRASRSGAGIDWVHVYAYPSDAAGNVTGPAIFLGAATLGYSRPDVGATYGPQFNNSGYNRSASGLPDGYYRVVPYVHGAWSGVTIQVDRLINVFGPRLAMDSPSQGATVIQPFNVGGWAIDRSATSGSGIAWVHVYAYPSNSAGTVTGSPIFIGAATLGYYRPDIGNIYGQQFNFSGYNRSTTGLIAGYYQIVAYAHAPKSALTLNLARLVYVT